MMFCRKLLTFASSSCGRILCKPKPSDTSLRDCRPFSSEAVTPQICIVGSGPAGFGVAQTLLKNHDSLVVDMYEKYPVPFGLIRYGVSPDHQDVKNATNGYTRTASSPRFSFYGNVDVSTDIDLNDLRSAYHAVVLCSGAQEEMKLNVPGMDSKNVFTSKQFVGWYNGHPDYQDIDVDLSGKTAVIVGLGNVALDCARMLLKPPDQLKDTDVTEGSFTALSSSNIHKVHLIGRRGPLQMACTRKELSEIADLCDVSTVIENEHFPHSVQEALKIKDLSKRKHQRLVKYLQKVASQSQKSKCEKQLFVKYLRTPLEVLAKDGKANGMLLLKREMKGDDAFNPTFADTNISARISCDVIISCIGYGNAPLDKSIPFSGGKISQNLGRIANHSGLYACGWCSHGAIGVLADSGNDSFITGTSVLEDISSVADEKLGSVQILSKLHEKAKQIVSWNEWQKVDEFEINEGKSAGKVREKLVTISEMLHVAKR